MPLSLSTAGDARFGKSAAGEEVAEFGYTFALSAKCETYLGSSLSVSSFSRLGCTLGTPFIARLWKRVFRIVAGNDLMGIG
jgi:hypothetical protein